MYLQLHGERNRSSRAIISLAFGPGGLTIILGLELLKVGHIS